MKTKIRELLTELTHLNGTSGFENEVVVFIRDKIKGYVDEIKIDAFGNIVGTKKGKPGSKSLMIAAHMDEIGLMISRIEKNGFLRFTLNGFPNPTTLSGRNVIVNGKYNGVIGTCNLHTTPVEERNMLPKANEFYIDIGANNDKEVMDMGIRVGSPVVFINEFRQLGNSDCYAGKAIDDRIGCLLNILLLEVVSSIDLGVDLHCVFSVQEEVGLKGAQMSAYKINPDFAIALDNVLAEDTPEQPVPSDTSVCLGKGPVINVKEFVAEFFVGLICHPRLVEYMIGVAKNNDIEYQLGMLIGGATDASAIYQTREGIPTLYMGTPCRYSHSQVETIDLNDVVSSSSLLIEFVKSLTPETNFDLL